MMRNHMLFACVGAAALGLAPARAAETVPPAVPLPDPFASTDQRLLDLEVDAVDVARWDDAPKTWLPTTLRLDGHVLREVHVRHKGNSSLRPVWEKPALKVDLNRTQAERTLDGRKGWNLHNGVHDCTLARESLAYAVLDQLGLPTAHTGIAQVRLNRVDLGSFVVVELQDDVWLPREAPTAVRMYDGKFQSDPMATDDEGPSKVDLTSELVHRFELEVGDDVGRADLQAIVDALEDPSVPLEDLPVDWPAVRRSLAVEEWIGQWDGYARNRNNYLLLVDEQGRASFAITDLDKAFRLDRGWDWLAWEGNEGERGILAERCFADAACHEAYLEALVQVDADIDVPALRAHLEGWLSRLEPSWATDPVMATCPRAEQVGNVLDRWLTLRSLYVAERVAGRAP